jgi:hypothetical protein
VAPTSGRPGDPFAPRLLDALRVAHGVPVDLEIVWTSGATAGITLETHEPSTRGWITHVLLRCYGSTAWSLEPTSSGTSPGCRSVGRALAGLEGPFRPLDVLGPPWSDAVVTSFGLLPVGASARWRLRPVAGPQSAPAPPSPIAQPLGTRIPASPAPSRLLDDAVATRAIEPRWEAQLVLTARDETALATAERLIAAGARRDGGNGLGWRRTGRWLGRRAPAVALSVSEVGALFPSPTLLPPGWTPAHGAAERTIVLGRDPRGYPVGLPVDLSAGRHALFLGETGMGKSSALVRAGVAAARMGGVVVFDPIGDTARRLLDRLPEDSVCRVVWISPSVSPVGVNALAAARGPGPSADRALAELVQSLRRVRAGHYVDAPYWGPRVEEMVHLALQAASLYPDGTFLDAVELLAHAGGPWRGVPSEAAAAVASLADRVRSRPEEVDGARRVIEEVVRVPVLARMLAAPRSEFSVAQAARDGQIVLVSGDAPEVGEAAARVLLSVHLALLWSELVARRPRTKVFVLADELPWYANDAATEIWRMGRRFNIHLWTATQSLRTLGEPLRETSVTNSADIVAFRGSPDDARELARWSPEMSAEATLRLARGEAAVLIGKGSGPSWVRLFFETERARPERWPRVWERCRPLWGPPPRDRAESAAPGDPADADSPRNVLLTLWAGLLASNGSSTLTVVLDDLRAEVDPAGGAVREAGQRLSAAGGLSASDGPRGRVWTVGRDPLSGLLAEGVGPEELGRADALWRAVLARPSRSGATQVL